MHRLIVTMISAFLSVSCITSSKAQTLSPRTVTAEAAKAFVTPQLIRDCNDKLIKAHPNSTILGKFFLSPYLAQRLDNRQRFLPGSDNQIVALAVVSSNAGLFGRQVKTLIGCSYRLEGNGLVFRDIHGPGSFPHLSQ